MEDLLIKDFKGKVVPLKVYQENCTIILSKKNDKSPEAEKRKVKVYIVNKSKLEAFQKVEVSQDEERKNLGELLFQIVNSIKQVVKGGEI